MKKIAIVALLVSGAALILGCLSLGTNSLEAYPVPVLGILFLTFAALFVYIRYSRKETKVAIVAIAMLALASAIILKVLPEYLHGFNINGLIYRSVISALLLIGLGIPATCYSLFYFLGATPRARDFSRYPLLVLPIILIAAAFIFIIYKIIAGGAPLLSGRS